MSTLSYIARQLRITPSHDPSLTVRDVAYLSGTDAHVNHKLDIFLPAPTPDSLEAIPVGVLREEDKRVPIVFHVHGGAWVYGGRGEEYCGAPSIARTCAQQGFVGVVASYRLAWISPTSFLAWSSIVGLIVLLVSLALRSWQLATGYAAFMTLAYVYNFFCRVRTPVNLEHMVDDLCLALVYVRDHIREHHPRADPDQIFVSGHSAGAHLISLLTLDRSHLNRHGLSPLSIRGVITMSGIYTLANPVHESMYNIRNLVYRVVYSSNLLFPDGRQMKDYSPIEYINEDDPLPPFLVMSARFDVGLKVDARRFVERLRKCHHQVEYHIIGGMTTHDAMTIRFAKHDAHRHFFTFIRQHMR